MKSGVSLTMYEVVVNFIRFIKPQILDEKAWSSEDISESGKDEDDTTTDAC